MIYQRICPSYQTLDRINRKKGVEVEQGRTESIQKAKKINVLYTSLSNF